MKRFVPYALMLTLSFPAAGGDLLDLYRQAQTNDPAWLAAQAGYQAGIEKAPQGRALLLPSLGLFASKSESDQHVVMPTKNNPYRYGTDSYAILLTQPLYRKQNAAAYAQGVAGANQSEFELETARQELILRASQ